VEVPKPHPVEHAFTLFANSISNWAGSPQGFVIALALMLVWAISGPFFGFSDLWQLSVNTGTTIVTFLMVFVIQNSQNRDTRAIQVKIDELIRATKGASNSLLDLELLSASEIEALHKRYRVIAERAKELGYSFETGSPELPADDPGAADVAAVVAAAKSAKPLRARRVRPAKPRKTASVNGKSAGG
jgi:low affinity Fe/Cu permease